jgi:hypothetical protein
LLVVLLLVLMLVLLGMVYGSQSTITRDLSDLAGKSVYKCHFEPSQETRIENTNRCVSEYYSKINKCNGARNNRK